MKKFTLLSVSLLSLSIVMAVSSFAWFQLKNNGQLDVDIHTQDGLEIFFSQTGTVDEAMMPAKLKKGVVSSDSGIIDGGEEVPKGPSVLPKIDGDYNYVISGNEFVSKNEYLEYPASIVYNQFEIESDYIELTFTFKVRYYNVDDEVGDDVDSLDIFKQVDALTFNFFLMNQELTDAELDTISTIKSTADTKVPVEKFLSEKTKEFDTLFALMKGDNVSNGGIEPNEVEAFRHTSSGDKETGVYTVDVKLADVDLTHYLLIESYYSVPDALIEGNLPLTGKFVLDISYGQKIS